MADYYGYCRSNYFRVKDLEQFKKVCDQFYLEFIVDEDDNNKVGFIVNHECGLPDNIEVMNEIYLNELEDESFELYDENKYENVFDIISEMLEDDEVMIINHIGNMKMRYLCGFASAYNNKGDHIYLDLHDIYEKSKTIGKNITRCEY